MMPSASPGGMRFQEEFTSRWQARSAALSLCQQTVELSDSEATSATRCLPPEIYRLQQRRAAGEVCCSADSTGCTVFGPEFASNDQPDTSSNSGFTFVPLVDHSRRTCMPNSQATGRADYLFGMDLGCLPHGQRLQAFTVLNSVDTTRVHAHTDTQTHPEVTVSCFSQNLESSQHTLFIANLLHGVSVNTNSGW